MADSSSRPGIRTVLHRVRQAVLEEKLVISHLETLDDSTQAVLVICWGADGNCGVGLLAPSPLRGRVGVGGRQAVCKNVTPLQSPCHPTPTLPRKGGGSKQKESERCRARNSTRPRPACLWTGCPRLPP